MKKRRLKFRMNEHKVMKKKKFRMDEEHDKSSDKGKTKIKKIKV